MSNYFLDEKNDNKNLNNTNDIARMAYSSVSSSPSINSNSKGKLDNYLEKTKLPIIDNKTRQFVNLKTNFGVAHAETCRSAR